MHIHNKEQDNEQRSRPLLYDLTIGQFPVKKTPGKCESITGQMPAYIPEMSNQVTTRAASLHQFLYISMVPLKPHYENTLLTQLLQLFTLCFNH